MIKVDALNFLQYPCSGIYFHGEIEGIVYAIVRTRNDKIIVPDLVSMNVNVSTYESGIYNCKFHEYFDCLLFLWYTDTTQKGLICFNSDTKALEYCCHKYVNKEFII